MKPSLQAAADQLRRCRTTSQIRQFRAGLTKEQAQAVIRALTPVERGAVLLALNFGGEATIIDPLADGLLAEGAGVRRLEDSWEVSA